ncbi:MAG: hypothetical protein AAFP10_00145 [Pseudomonadota bacterium]
MPDSASVARRSPKTPANTCRSVRSEATVTALPDWLPLYPV